MITTQDILSAHNRIAPYVTETPVEAVSPFHDSGKEVLLKLENLQVSGSFKSRGGLNKILKTWEANPQAEFVAPTAGGHGVGLSYSAKVLGAKSHIFMPENADPDRKKDIISNGATVRFFSSVPEARKEALRLEKEKGLTFASAYNDTEMIEGGGTIGLELIKQAADIDCLVCGVGGGVATLPGWLSS